nr:uncharacterized protein LOC123766096 isoform X2 [Procambarus clarkii]
MFSQFRFKFFWEMDRCSMCGRNFQKFPPPDFFRIECIPDDQLVICEQCENLKRMQRKEKQEKEEERRRREEQMKKEEKRRRREEKLKKEKEERRQQVEQMRRDAQLWREEELKEERRQQVEQMRRDAQLWREEELKEERRQQVEQMRRDAQLWREEELKEEEEKRRRREEQMKKEKEERRRREEQLKKEKEERRRREEQLRKKEEEKRRGEEQLKKEEERRRREEQLRKEEERRRREEQLKKEEERRRREEQLKKEEERRRREEQLKKEEERRRREEQLKKEEERRRREEQLRKEEERRRREEQLKKEEERRRREEQLKKEEERRRREEQLKKEEERRRREEQLKKEEERRRREEQLKKEEERRRREEQLKKEEERRRREEQLKKEEERRRREEQLKNEEERRRREEQLKKEEERRRREEQLRKEEERRRREEQLKKEEERRRREEQLKKEEERRRREEQLKKEEERRRREEQLKKEEERRRREEQLKKEEERRRREEQLKKEEERRRREEQLKKEEERRRREEQLKNEEERRRREEQLKKEEERRRREEQLKKEEERRRREEQLKKEEERRRREEQLKKKAEEKRRREEQLKRKEEKEKRHEGEELRARLVETFQTAKSLSLAGRDSVKVSNNKMTEGERTVRYFDRCEAFDMPSDQEHLNVTSGIAIGALDFSHITPEQIKKLILTLDNLLFGEQSCKVPKEEDLIHAQVIIQELIIVSLDVSDRASLERVVQSVNFTVETLVITGSNFSESLELTKALFDTFRYLRASSTPYDLATTAIVNKWRKKELSVEENFLLKFHEILLNTMEDNDEVTNILKVQKTCFELLVATVIQTSFDGLQSELFKDLIGLVQRNYWTPIEAVNLLKILTEKFEDIISAVKVINLLYTNNISPESQNKNYFLKRFLNLIDSKDDYQNIENYFRKEYVRLDIILANIKENKQLQETTIEQIHTIVHTVQTKLKLQQNEKHKICQIQLFTPSGHLTDNLQQVLLALCQAVFKSLNEWPTVEQMIRWCINVLCENGKVIISKDDSCVVAMFAALKVLRGEWVDIVWSSSALCHEELEQWSNFFNNIDIAFDTASNKPQQEALHSNIINVTEDFITSIYLQAKFEQKKENQVCLVQNIILQEDPSYLKHCSQVTNTFDDNALTTKVSSLLQTLMATTIDSKSFVNKVTNFIRTLFYAHSRNNFERQKNLLKYLEKFIKSFRETTGKRFHIKHVNELERKCLELVVEAVSQVLHDDPHSETAVKICLRLLQSDLWKPVEMVDLLTGLTLKYDHITTMKILHLAEIHRVSDEWKDKDERSLLHLIESSDAQSMLEHFKLSLNLENEKSLEIVRNEIMQMNNIKQTIVDKVCCIVRNVQKQIEDFKKDVVDGNFCLRNYFEKFSKNPENLQKILFVLCKVVFEQMKWWPRVTQMVSWCLLVLSDSGQLVELGTGEGKSCVIAMFAATRVLMGEKVDIATSSPVLCERDETEWREYYQYFNISVDINTNKMNDGERKKCYESGIVYGTVETFAADHLRQTFELRDIRPDRQFQCIIVDEVDSVLLDRGVQLTNLSSDVVSMHHLNPILAMIWSVVSQYGLVGTENKVFIRGPALPFYSAVYNSLDTEELEIQEPIDILTIAETNNFVPSGFTKEIYKTDKLFDKLKIVSQDTMLEFLSKAEEYFPCQFIPFIQDERGMLQPTGRSSEELEDIQEIPLLVLQDGLCCALYDSDGTLWGPIGNNTRHHLQFTPCEKNQEKLDIPGFLRDLVETKMETWVQKAFMALKFQEGREYIVEGEQILPVDFLSTGIVEMNMKWGDGLMQFLELKHQTKLSTLSTVTNFISNVTFFKMYKNQIYGTTGTLGTESDLHCLTKLYPTLSACRVPSFNRSKLFEMKGEITGSPDDWQKEIITCVQNQIKPTEYRRGRAALIICETINKAKEIHSALKDQVLGELKMYIHSNSDNLAITQSVLNPGDVIVATNLAGRGTDIKISDEVNDGGGLFVVLTFLSMNSRVELQAFGRTARKGKPGSAQLIVCSSHLQVSLRSAETLQALKVKRDQRARTKVEKIMTDHVPEIFLREELFVKYCDILKDIYSNTQDLHERQVTVAAMNEYWGIWLQIKSKEILQLKKEDLVLCLTEDIRNAKHQLESNESPSSCIYHYIHLANTLLFDNKIQESARLYKKAMIIDPSWAAIAFYSHAYCTMKARRRNYIDNATEDLKKARDSVGIFQEQCIVTSQLVNMSIRDSDGANSRFEKRIQSKLEMLRIFQKNIEEAIDKLNKMKQSDKDANVEEASVFSMVPEFQTEIREELYEFYKLGLVNIFSVKEEKRFCWQGLVVTILGITQVAVGVFMISISSGLLANVGMELISEGISDIIYGLGAMASGEFSWTSWAIGKVVSIVVSLVGFCFGKILSKGFKGIKSAMKGSKLTSLPKTLSKQFKGGLTAVLKKNMKTAATFAGKQLVEQSVMYGISQTEEYVVDKILDKIKEVMRPAAIDKVKRDMEETQLQSQVNNLIMLKVSSTNQIKYLLEHKEHNKIIKDIFQSLADGVLKENFNNFDSLKKHSSSIFNVIEKAKLEVTGKKKTILTVIQIGHMSALCVCAVDAILTLCTEFNSKYCNNVKIFYEKEVSNNHIENKIELSSEEKQSLKVLREQLADVIGKQLADAAVDIFHTIFSSHLVSIAQTNINKHISQFLSSKMYTERNLEKLKAGQYSLDIASAEINTIKKENLTNQEHQSVQSYSQKIEDAQSAGSLLDLRVLSEETGTKIVVVEDKHGTLSKMYELDPSTTTASKTVELIYKPKDNKYPDGHYDVRINGKVVKIESEGRSCMFQALARGLNHGASEEQVRSEARRLRQMEAQALRESPHHWAHLIQRKEYIDRVRNCDWFNVEGGRRAVNEALDDIDAYNDQRRKNKGIGDQVNADHQPPVSCVVNAYDKNPESELSQKLMTLATNGKPLDSNNIDKVKRNHGYYLPAVTVKKEDHINFPTTKSPKCRNLITESIAENDPISMTKYSSIGSINQDYHNGKKQMSKDDRANLKKRHLGFFNYYTEKNIYTPEQHKHLKTWFENESYLDPKDQHVKKARDLLN